MHATAPMNAASPLVTIVTATLNRSAMLEATIRSIRGQSYPKIEHIVVDGGSTDDTIAMLGRYDGTYGLRWMSEPDDGMYNAINKGLRRGSGSIQAYLNSDDLYFPWTIDVVVRAFARHPEADVVYGDVLDIDELTGRAKVAWNLPFDLDYIRRFGYIWQPGFFWRKQVFDAAGGFDEAIRYSADLDFWLRLGADGRRFRKINEFLAVVRQHPDTASVVHRPEVIEEVAAMRARHVPPNGRTGPSFIAGDRRRRQRWSRIYLLALVLQSLVPASLRRGPWARFFGAGRTRISYSMLALEPIRALGRRLAHVGGGPMLRPSRNWLEPLD